MIRAGLLALFCLLAALPRMAPAAALPEEQVKAAFIFNFLLFTNWPSGREPPEQLHLCLLGSDAITKSLRELDGRKLGPSTVKIAGIREDADAKECNAVYLAPQQRARWSDWLASPKARGILSITDGGEKLSSTGSILVVAVRDDRVVFDLDLPKARLQRLSFSPRVLQMAGKTPR